MPFTKISEIATKIFNFDISNIKIFTLKVLKLISILIRRKIDENLLIFGGNLGKAFLGNTKYLFLYFNKYSNYKCLWISRSKEIVKHLQEQGFNSLYAFSLRTFFKLRSARCIFITHGEGDILPIEFSPQTQIILTWHGNPMKKIGFDAPRFLGNRYNYIVLKKLVKDLTYLLSPSEEIKKNFKSAFKIPQKKIKITGLPQNDFLFNKKKGEIKKLKQKFRVPEGIKNIIMYAPTFREDFLGKIPFSKEELLELENFLEESNSILIYKAHIFIEAFDLKDFKRMIIPDKYSDTQELLLITDILISDYSSIMHDFSILQKPIIVFAYDLELYQKQRGMYYKDYEKIAPGPIAKNGRELIYYLKNIAEWAHKYESKRNKIRDLFNKYIDDKSCERVAKLLNLRIK